MMNTRNRTWDDLVVMREHGAPRPDGRTADSAVQIVRCTRGHVREFRFLITSAEVHDLEGWRIWMQRKAAARPCGVCGAVQTTEKLRLGTWLPSARLDLLLSLEDDELRIAVCPRNGKITELRPNDPILEEIGPASATRFAHHANADTRGHILAWVLRLWPEYVPAMREQARCERQLGNLEEARAWAERAVDAEPQDAEGWFMLGDILDEIHEEDGALFAYACCIALDPSHAEAHNQRGMVLRKVGRVEEARRAYQRVLKLVPGHAAALNNLAVLRHRSGDLLGVLDVLAELRPSTLARQPVLAESLLQIVAATGDDLALRDLWYDAMRAYTLATQLAPGNALIWVKLASTYMRLGCWRDAVVAAHHAVLIDADYPGAHAMLDAARANLPAPRPHAER